MTLKRRLTLKDVAAAANVSEITVSRALRGAGVVSLRTQEKVRRIADEMGYVPNKLAGSLATARSNQVAVIIPSLVNNVFSRVLLGISEELEKAGYNPVIGITGYDLEREESLVRSMVSWRPAGVIIANLIHSHGTQNILRNAAFPVVEMMDSAGEPIDICIGLDHAAAVKSLIEYLLERGYRNFGYLGWNTNDFAAATRFKAVKERLEKERLNVVAPDVFQHPPDLNSGKSATAGLLAVHPDLDVIVYSNDTAACGGMLHCIEKGIEVPGQLAIAGFSGLRSGQAMPKPLTTIKSKRFEIGRRSARAVLNRLVGQGVPRVVDLGFELISGESA